MLQNPFLGFIFALANRKRGCQRCGSSAWLEYMPVTHGVAGSSPVRTARALGEIRALFLFFSDGFKADCGVAVGGKGCEEIHNHL